jgi:hypothetical protein
MNFSQNMVSDLHKAWVIDATCRRFVVMLDILGVLIHNVDRYSFNSIN